MSVARVAANPLRKTHFERPADAEPLSMFRKTNMLAQCLFVLQGPVVPKALETERGQFDSCADVSIMMLREN
jgi:hypothetical protein